MLPSPSSSFTNFTNNSDLSIDIMATATFIRRFSTPSMQAPTHSTASSHTAADEDAVGVVNALTAYFLPEATASVLADVVIEDVTESLLTFHAADEQDVEDCDLPETILPMSPEPSPRDRSASALSQAAIDTATATLTSWFSFEDFVHEDEEELEDEYVNKYDDDFLDGLDDDDGDNTSNSCQEPEFLSIPAKLSLIAEEDFSTSSKATSFAPWTMKALGWPWVRSN